jgi:hypothetical protein
METVGVVAVVIAGLIVVGAAVVGLRSIPDVRRYFRIRHM